MRVRHFPGMRRDVRLPNVQTGGGPLLGRLRGRRKIGRYVRGLLGGATGLKATSRNIHLRGTPRRTDQGEGSVLD